MPCAKVRKYKHTITNTYIYIYICKRNLYVLFDMAAFCIKVLIVLIVLNFQNNILNY